MLLLTEILEENQIPPEKLLKALEKYTLTVDKFLETMDSEEEDVKYVSIKEMNNVVENFINLLDFYYSNTKKKT